MGGIGSHTAGLTPSRSFSSPTATQGDIVRRSGFGGGLGGWRGGPRAKQSSHTSLPTEDIGGRFTGGGGLTGPV